MCWAVIAAIKCGTESFHDFRQITVNSCVVTRSTRALALYGFDGGTFEQISVNGLVCDTDVAFILNHPIHFDARKRSPESLPSVMRDIRIGNFSAVTDGRILLTAADDCTVENISIDGLSMRYALFCDPAEVAPGATSMQASQHSPEARAARAAIVSDGVQALSIRNVGIKWPDSVDHPGWGAGLTRIENGGDRQFGPADKGDDVDFAVLWARDTSGLIEVGQLTAANGSANTTIDSDNLIIR